MKRKRLKCYLSIILIWFFVLGLWGVAAASSIVDTSGFITGTDGHVYELGQSDHSGSFTATLSDLSFGGLEFESLMLSISTSKDIVDSISESGSFGFNMEPGIAYFANVFGKAGGSFNTGCYGLEIVSTPTHAPIPTSLLLLFSGLLGLMSVRRRASGIGKKGQDLR